MAWLLEAPEFAPPGEEACVVRRLLDDPDEIWAERQPPPSPSWPPPPGGNGPRDGSHRVHLACWRDPLDGEEYCRALTFLYDVQHDAWRLEGAPVVMFGSPEHEALRRDVRIYARR